MKKNKKNIINPHNSPYLKRHFIFYFYYRSLHDYIIAAAAAVVADSSVIVTHTPTQYMCIIIIFIT